MGIILGTLFSLLMFTGLTAPFLVAWGYIIDIYYNCGDEELESTMEKMDVKSGVCVAGVRHAKRGITKIVAGGKGMVVSGAAATLERHVFTRNMTHPRDFPKANVD